VLTRSGRLRRACDGLYEPSRIRGQLMTARCGEINPDFGAGAQRNPSARVISTDSGPLV
jgi:hypothetical protein